MAALVGLALDPSASKTARARAAGILGRVNTRQAAEGLVRLARDRDPALAAAALNALCDVDAGRLDALPDEVLLRRLDVPPADPRAGDGAVEVRLLGRKRRIGILAGLVGIDRFKPLAARALAELGPAGAAALAEALREP